MKIKKILTLIITGLLFIVINFAYAAPTAVVTYTSFEGVQNKVEKQKPAQNKYILGKPYKLDTHKKDIGKNKEELKCPTDVKQCEDGTFVNRAGKDCQFEKCPINEKDIKILSKGSEIQKIKDNCSEEFNPVCALKDNNIRCIKAPCLTKVKKTYQNKCEAEKDGAKIIANVSCEEQQQQKASSVQYLWNILDSKQIKTNSLTKAVYPEMKVELKKDSVIAKEDSSIRITKIVEAIKNSDTEEGRQSVFKKEFLLENREKKVDADILKNKKNKNEIIFKKSKEVFEKFDYFISKAKSVEKKISSVVVQLDKNDIKTKDFLNRLQKMKEDIKKAEELKTLGWLKFNMVITLDNKDSIKISISEAKEHLKETKKIIKGVFLESKKIIKDIKNR